MVHEAERGRALSTSVLLTVFRVFVRLCRLRVVHVVFRHGGGLWARRAGPGDGPAGWLPAERDSGPARRRIGRLRSKKNHKHTGAVRGVLRGRRPMSRSSIRPTKLSSLTSIGPTRLPTRLWSLTGRCCLAASVGRLPILLGGWRLGPSAGRLLGGWRLAASVGRLPILPGGGFLASWHARRRAIRARARDLNLSVSRRPLKRARHLLAMRWASQRLRLAASK
jgi:hypothetical protein